MASTDLSTAKVSSLCFKVTDLCVVRSTQLGVVVAPGGMESAAAGAMRRQSDVLVRASRQGDRVVPLEGQGAALAPGGSVLTTGTAR